MSSETEYTIQRCKNCGRKTEHRKVKSGTSANGNQKWRVRCSGCHADENRATTRKRMAKKRKKDPSYGRSLIEKERING